MVSPERAAVVPLVDTLPIIETAGLTRRFGALVAVDGVDLAVPRGCFYGFLGPNGAGKSTTIKMLTGLLAPSAGSIRVLGRDISRPSEAIEVKRRLGVVPENLALYDNLTAHEYLTFVGRMHELDPSVTAARSRELLDVMGLAGEGKKLALEYSHGMRKKLALAAALIHDPELLFLDEPFEGVDAISSKMLREVLLRCVERGATIFLTSHVLEIVEKLCTHVGIISSGRIVHQGPLAELQRGRSLEERFLEVAGGGGDGAAPTLSWLEG